METVSAKQSLSISLQPGSALIDVRAESEFAQGHIPHFLNLPLLNDTERHQVGLAYKTFGQERAIKLGHGLVNPQANERIEGWKNEICISSHKRGLITCWRGGLRSKLVTLEMTKLGLAAIQVEGGYKAMRRELLLTLEGPPSLYVLSGMTGSGKTQMIRALPTTNKIDLEALAEHRGSSFGQLLAVKQPSTATFENRLALSIWEKTGPLVVEDESRGIGRVTIPTGFLKQLRTAPLIILDMPVEQRAKHIYEEYIATPYAAGVPLPTLQLEAVKGLQCIRKRLGGSLTDLLLSKTHAAFDRDNIDLELHMIWISLLLVEYYDKLYLHSTAYWERPVLHQGDYDACYQWILHHLNLLSR